MVAEGKIKLTTKYVEKASDETLEKVYKNYIAKQLDETNEQITKILINQLSELLTSLEMIEDGKKPEDELGNNELFKRDVKTVLSYITPYIPLIGLACGGICIGRHVMKKRSSDVKEEEENQKECFLKKFRNENNVTKYFSLRIRGPQLYARMGIPLKFLISHTYYVLKFP